MTDGTLLRLPQVRPLREPMHAQQSPQKATNAVFDSVYGVGMLIMRIVESDWMRLLMFAACGCIAGVGLVRQIAWLIGYLIVILIWNDVVKAAMNDRVGRRVKIIVGVSIITIASVVVPASIVESSAGATDSVVAKLMSDGILAMYVLVLDCFGELRAGLPSWLRGIRCAPNIILHMHERTKSLICGQHPPNLTVLACVGFSGVVYAWKLMRILKMFQGISADSRHEHKLQDIIRNTLHTLMCAVAAGVTLVIALITLFSLRLSPEKSPYGYFGYQITVHIFVECVGAGALVYSTYQAPKQRRARSVASPMASSMQAPLL